MDLDAFMGDNWIWYFGGARFPCVDLGTLHFSNAAQPRQGSRLPLGGEHGGRGSHQDTPMRHIRPARTSAGPGRRTVLRTGTSPARISGSLEAAAAQTLFPGSPIGVNGSLKNGTDTTRRHYIARTGKKTAVTVGRRC